MHPIQSPGISNHRHDTTTNFFSLQFALFYFRSQGHSAWGQFQLLGRVRPCDGLINVYKTYVSDLRIPHKVILCSNLYLSSFQQNDGIRGNWLYRGYLIGTGEEGNIVGRWRDTLSPAEVHGYEGRYTLTRRKNPDGI